MWSARDRRCVLLPAALLWSVVLLVPFTGIAADATTMARRIVDALIEAREENAELKQASEKLVTECEALKVTRGALQRERDALRRAHTEEVGRREGLESVVTALEQKQRQLKSRVEDLESEVDRLLSPPPCPWAVMLTNITGTAMSQLQTACGRGSHAPSAAHGSKRLTRKARAQGIPRERPLPRHDPVLALALSDVALALQAAGEFEKAETYFAWALMILNAGQAGNHLPTATALNNLGGLYLEMKEYAKAENVYRSSLVEYGYAFDDEHPKLAALQNKLAAALRGQDRFLEAERAYHKSIATYESAFGAGHPQLVAPIHNLAQLYLDMSRYDEAAAWLNRAMAIARRKAEAKPYIAYLEESERRLDSVRSDSGGESPAVAPNKTAKMEP
jgi:tetratricopeptide (TPR) repeat protein